jgi:hypothetical protein
MPSQKRKPTKKALRKWGKKGGKARLRTMSEQERRERAIKAAAARWAKRPAVEAEQSATQ